MPRLACPDQGTGLPVRKPAPRRYEHERPGDLIHVDIKKLGRIPEGGGHRSLGRAAGRKNRRAGTGYAYLHHAVDEHLRLAYSEILTDEKKETATAFWLRAAAFFAAHGITVKAGPTPGPTHQKSNGQPLTRTGYVSTITTEPIPASEVKLPSAAFMTYVGTTP
ncbi:UNVERIFIED_ORG: hypothetical protein ABIB52_002324 [Arthrobacter sp. UYCu721]